jgi:hypothetical protein
MNFHAKRLRSQISDLAELPARMIQELRDREKILSFKYLSLRIGGA